ncbi:MAG: hypothetical protein AAGD25_03565 [Cyanobacteria bacterium P01_F01_bin.150]
MTEINTMGDRKHQQALRCLQVFKEQFEDQAYSEQVLDLASHAAFPLTLTTDLMDCLRENFFSDCPWIASSDILLSGLCNSVGYDLYEMAAATKILLLKRLLDRFGKDRLDKLEIFMGDYIQHHLSLNPKSDRILNVGEPGAPLK